eukprot:8132963-Pyramimonas_sp.AAC.1
MMLMKRIVNNNPVSIRTRFVHTARAVGQGPWTGLGQKRTTEATPSLCCSIHARAALLLNCMRCTAYILYPLQRIFRDTCN